MSFSHEIAARTLWAEARGEPLDGQRAVAHVMVNRVHDGRFGANLAAVCCAPLQFSCWNVHDPNRVPMVSLADNDPALLRLTAILESAANGMDIDPTNGALYYYSDSMTTPPDWAAKMQFCGKFGRQLFYTDRPGVA